MKRYLVMIAIACMLSAGPGFGVAAQSNKISLNKLLPVLIDVKQIVPIDAVIVDPAGMTLTVPLTMTVNLQVRLDGAQLASAEVVTPTQPIVVTARPTEIQAATGDSTINDEDDEKH